MGIKVSDHPSLMLAIQKQMQTGPQPPKKMWIARFGSLKIKPIVMRDPVQFKKTIESIKALNPGLTVHLFESEGI